MSGDTFIDWINLSQEHKPGSIPLVGEGVLLRAAGLQWIETTSSELLVCMDAGDRVSLTVPGLQHAGSHSTSVRLRSDGTRMSLSGNPGRFGRQDNVFNYPLAPTLELASDIVAAHGLPAFTAGDRLYRSDIKERDAHLGLWWQWTGASFRELHVTRNFQTGGEAVAREFISWAASQRAARISKGVYGDETVIFGALAKKGKPLHKAIVVYRKSAEMLAHAKGDVEKKRVKDSRVYQYAVDTGLVRVECKWGGHFLRDNGIKYMGGTTMDNVISIFDAETNFLLNCSPDRVVRLVSDMPRNLRLPALAWIRGDDIRELVSRATYYRIVRGLRDYGLDVSERRRGCEGPSTAERDLQGMLDRLPKFKLSALPCPEWYDLPKWQEAA